MYLALMMPSAPRPPVMTQRPGSASCAGLPGAGGAVVTTLPIARAADSCRRPDAASASGYATGASGLIAPAGQCTNYKNRTANRLSSIPAIWPLPSRRIIMLSATTAPQQLWEPKQGYMLQQVQAQRAAYRR